MEEKEVTIVTVQDNGQAGTATIISTGENVDFVNPGRAVPVNPTETAIAQILRITRGNPPKDDIIAVLIRK